MNDSGKTVKSLVRIKADYKLIKNKHRCASVTIDLELADGVGEGGDGITALMCAVHNVKGRVITALAEEFLP